MKTTTFSGIALALMVSGQALAQTAVVQNNPVANNATVNDNGFYTRTAIVQDTAGTNTATYNLTNGSFSRGLFFQNDQVGANNTLNAAATATNSAFIVIQQTGPAFTLPQLNMIANNFLFGPEVLGAQPRLAAFAANQFSSGLLNRLDLTYGCAPAAPQDPALVTKPSIETCNPLQVFVDAGLGIDARSTTVGSQGYQGLSAQLSGGIVYQINPVFRVGSAVSFGYGRADFSGGNGSSNLLSLQGSVFGALDLDNGLFARAVGTLGWHQFEISRPNFVGSTRARPNGTSFTAEFKGGYLYGMDGFRVGPVVGLRYNTVSINAFSENAVPLIGFDTRSFALDSLVASGGLRIASPLGQNSSSFFLDVMAEGELMQNRFQIYRMNLQADPGVTIQLPVERDKGIYARLAAGFQGEFGDGWSGQISANATLFRKSGNEFGINLGMTKRF